MEKRKVIKEDIDKVRNIDGFPIGTDEDIINLSDAPYYTAFPNPFIADFIKENGHPYDEATDDYQCEPFAADVSEGKNDPIYMAHTYHTKVPHKAIMKYVLHYTKPGDVIYDGFCGTGMTGVAAQMCGLVNEQSKLQYQQEIGKDIKFGPRNVILADLSPVATFISNNYNSKTDSINLKNRFLAILNETEKELGWMYETSHIDQGNLINTSEKGRINYVVWSNVYICPNCGKEFVFWDEAVDQQEKAISNNLICPHCNALISKKNCDSAQEIIYDSSLKQNITIDKKAPTLINYTYQNRRYTKKPDSEDIKLIKRIQSSSIPYWHPTDRMCAGIESRRNDKAGITHIHHFFTKRNLLYLSKFYSLINSDSEDQKVKFIFTSVLQNASKMYKYRTDGKGGIVAGTMYIPALYQENNVYNLLLNKSEMILKACEQYKGNNFIISTNSSTKSTVPNNSVDYIFTDPPFGDNLNYSELSFLWETWLKVRTNNTEEAVINRIQHKGIYEYQKLMEDCFVDYFKILKPNRWLTVEFHNSKNAVWNAIQEAILKAGFVIADVRTLDKKQGSFKQVTNSGSVKQDLVISAYKPKDSFKKQLYEQAGTEETAWAFVRQHLEKIPVVVDADHNGKIDILPERQAYLLFDRMVAYHIMNGLPIPVNAPSFYKGLDNNFIKRDEMYFLPSQINEYDTARIKMDIEQIQFDFFVTNEKTAISWLYQQLQTPQTYQELQPKFMQETKSIDQYESIPELAILLDENFLRNDKNQWYIPDRTKEADIARLREKNLLKEFEGYMRSSGKLKLFRSEAIRAGFSHLWKDKNYQAIISIAQRLPEQTIQEDPNLLMYYDISLSRL